MSIQTTLFDLALAIHEEAIALVGDGEEANALAMAALAGLLSDSKLDNSAKVPARATRTPRFAEQPPMRLSA